MSTDEAPDRLDLIWSLVTLQMAHENRLLNGEEADDATERYRRAVFQQALEQGIPIPVIPGGPNWTLH